MSHRPHACVAWSEIRGSPSSPPNKSAHSATASALNRYLLSWAGFERTNPALPGVRDKFEKFAAKGAEVHGRCFFNGLANIQATGVEKFEGGLDFVSIV